MRAPICAREPEHAGRAARLAAHAASSMAGQLVLLERLGRGGTAEVWRARDRDRGPVALKILKPELRADPRAAALLQHEHAVLEAVRHPHVVASFGLVESAGRPALALELLAGGDIVPLLGAPPHTWMAAAAAIIAALRHIHERGFAYRDLKPRNVLFDAAGAVRLIDFAAAWPLDRVPPAGGTTAAYRPAEAPPAAAVAEDELALAVLLYELFTGRLPFGADGLDRGRELAPPIAAALHPPPALAVLGELVTAILAGRTSRGGSLSELAAVIDTVAAGHP